MSVHGDVLQKVADHVKRTGRFTSFARHEPLHALGQGVHGALWYDRTEPITRSGMASTSGVIVLTFRVYHPLKQSGTPADEVDVLLADAVDRVLASLQAGFTLDGLLRCIDVYGGESGVTLTSQGGYVNLDGVLHRIITTTVPCVVNDLWSQEA